MESLISTSMTLQNSSIKEITIIALLHNIKEKNILGAPIEDFDIAEAIAFVIDKELVIRTEYGNFELTNKGLDLLFGVITWESLSEKN